LKKKSLTTKIAVADDHFGDQIDIDITIEATIIALRG
jgi:hypothetical protein